MSDTTSRLRPSTAPAERTGGLKSSQSFAVGTRVRRVDPAHLVGITARAYGEASAERVLPAATLLRPLAEYGIAAGETLCGVAA